MKTRVASASHGILCLPFERSSGEVIHFPSLPMHHPHAHKGLDVTAVIIFLHDVQLLPVVVT